MAAMTLKFNFECVIQYYTDQWRSHGLRQLVDNESVTICQQTYCKLIVKICCQQACRKLIKLTILFHLVDKLPEKLTTCNK